MVHIPLLFGSYYTNIVHKINPLIEDYMKDTLPYPTVKLVKNIFAEKLNLRSSANWKGEIVNTLNTNCSLTYVEGHIYASNGSTKMYRYKNNVYVTASGKYTRVIDLVN